jgi:hypothetical protein
VRDQFAEMASETNTLAERVSDLMYDSLRQQMSSERADGATDVERQLAKVRRSLTKAEQILRDLAAEH